MSESFEVFGFTVSLTLSFLQCDYGRLVQMKI